MRREEITARVKTRPNQRPEDNITHSRTHQIGFPQGYHGELTIEYKPGEYLLPEDGLDTLAEDGFFALTFSELAGEIAAERVVSDFYWALIDLLYPQSSYLDQPWDHLPIVVDLRYGENDVSEYHVSMGNYR